MADVFISYAREDKAKAERVAQGLTAMGLIAFWDTDIPPGQTWADYIESKLAQCNAVIVLWSEHSTKSQWVREEARMGREKAKLIPALLDSSQAPFGFGEVQAADLSQWDGSFEHPAWIRFAQAVYRTARGSDPASAASAPPPQPQAAWTPPPQPQPQTSGWQTPPPSSGGWQTQGQQSQQNWAGAAPSAGGAETLQPIEYIQKCLRLYADGKGRARRAEYGWFMLAVFGVGVIAGFLDVTIFGFNPYTQTANSYLFTIIVGLGLLAPSVAAASRRAHDFGQSGWLAALTVIPYLGILAVLAFVFIPGQPGSNAHGANPKGE